jgi:hypothetical protein
MSLRPPNRRMVPVFSARRGADVPVKATLRQPA